MVLRDAVHKGGVASFATLPGDAYEYRIDYEQSEGAVWLKSRKTEREWECMIYNCDVFEEDPVYRDQFTMEITLLELALHHDPRVHKTAVCKNVILTRSGDDLVMQLSERVYTRRNPEWGPTLQFTLEWVRGSGTLPHGMSRDPPMPLEPEEPPKPKVSRDEQQKELLTRLRDENKALKAAKRERASEVKQWKTENDALRRENAQLKLANDTQYAQLIKLGGSHEFQRQHIEHLRRKIQALEQQHQVAQAHTATGAAATQQNTVNNLLIDVESSESSDDQDDEQHEAMQDHNKRRCTSNGC